MYEISKVLPILDILAVILAMISIIVSIFIANGILGVHGHLNEEQVLQAERQNKIIKQQEELLKTLEAYLVKNPQSYNAKT